MIGFVRCLGFIALLVSSAPLFAQSADTNSSSPGAGAPVYSVEGFRSARFGMNEADVRKAIAADFKIDGKSITREDNQLERTTVLAITVADLLPGAGPARVTYIFGFTRHQLIQVNVLWATPKKEGATNALAVPGATLRNYFLGYSYAADTVARDVALSDGAALLFQGGDQKGRIVSLAVGEGIVENAKGDVSWFLRLSYVQDPQNPDVFRLKPGAF